MKGQTSARNDESSSLDLSSYRSVRQIDPPVEEGADYQEIRLVSQEETYHRSNSKYLASFIKKDVGASS